MEKFLKHPSILLIRESVLLYFSHRVPQAAAALAYFMLLSVFPVLICVSSVLGLLDINIASMIGELQAFLPEDALQLIEGYLSYISRYRSPGFFIAGFLAGWFTSAAAFRTIARVIIDMYDEVSHSFLRGMVSSILFPVALLVTVDLSAVVVVASQHTLKIITGHFEFLENGIHIWNLLRYVLLFSLFLLFIWAVLEMAAPKGTPKMPVLVSSFVSALALVVSSAVFSWFISMSARYSLVYGSLVSLIVMLVWLYLCGQILFLAIVFTSVWYRRRKESHNRKNG